MPVEVPLSLGGCFLIQGWVIHPPPIAGSIGSLFQVFSALGIFLGSVVGPRRFLTGWGPVSLAEPSQAGQWSAASTQLEVPTSGLNSVHPPPNENGQLERSEGAV